MSDVMELSKETAQNFIEYYKIETKTALPKPEAVTFFEAPWDHELKAGAIDADGKEVRYKIKKGDLVVINPDGRVWECSKEFFNEHFDEVK